MMEHYAKKIKIFILFCLLFATGCVAVIPITDKTYVAKCEISIDRKTLKVIDLAKETYSYYSIGGLLLMPISRIVSGTYVAINNTYYSAKEKIVCS